MGDNASFLTSVEMSASSFGRDRDILFIDGVEILGASFVVPPSDEFELPVLTPTAPISGSMRFQTGPVYRCTDSEPRIDYTVPSEVLVWECKYCHRRYYTEKPPVVCEGSGGNSCGGSDYRAIRMEVESE